MQTNNSPQSIDLLADLARRGIKFVVSEAVSASRATTLRDVLESAETRLRAQQSTTPAATVRRFTHKRAGLFAISTPGPIPAAIGGVPGTAVASGASMKVFTAKSVAILGADVPVADGGAKELRVTAMYIGCDVVRVDIPEGGLQVEAFVRLLRDNPSLLSAAYPATGITINFANPTPHKAKPVQIVFAGAVEVDGFFESPQEEQERSKHLSNYSFGLPVTDVPKGDRVSVDKAPQRSFSPMFFTATGMDTPVVDGGIQELLVTGMHVGCDPTFVNRPNVRGAGVRIGELSRMLKELGFSFDSLYPAVPVTIDLYNPTDIDIKDVQIVFSGKTVS